MKKIQTLVFQNLKKEKGQYISFGVILLLTAFVLNIALVLAFQIDRTYDETFSDLQTGNIHFAVLEAEDADSLPEDIRQIQGVERMECREGIFTAAVVKDFRDTDFSMNTVFYDLDETDTLDQYEMVEQSGEKMDDPVYIPLYVAQFGQFQVGEEITYQIDGKDETFQIAGILEEIQYGNYGKNRL